MKLEVYGEIYGKLIDGVRTVAKGEYNGYEFQIISTRNCYPCAYIKIPKEHVFYNKSCSFLNKFIDVHGGFTFSDFFENGDYYIGWDYAHCCDYKANFDYYVADSKKWAVEEIAEEIKQAIEQIPPTVDKINSMCEFIKICETNPDIQHYEIELNIVKELLKKEGYLE